MKTLKHGIDISMWQAGIDLAAVKHDFLIVKATGGNGYTDPEFNTFAAHANGFYHFARADLNPSGAKGEAQWFVKTVKPHLTKESILVLDYEGNSVKQGPKWAETWLAEVYRLLKVRPFFYSNPSTINTYNYAKIAEDHPLWLADYGTDKRINGYNPPKRPNVRFWGEPLIHQYSQKGRLPGYGKDLDLNVKYATAAKPVLRMQSPVQGEVTSEYGSRWGTLHAGMDIAAPLGSKVYPLFRESVVVMVVNNRRPGQTSAGHPIPGRSPNGVLLKNPDGEHQWFGHITPMVKKGQKVYFDTVLGTIDLSGQTTGPHVHVETWANSNANSHMDPRISFSYFGVVPGSAPHLGKGQSKPVPAPKPKPKPTPTKPKGKYGLTVADIERIQEALKLMGLYHGLIDGDYGDQTRSAVRRFQVSLNTYAMAGLVQDGIWGPVVQGWYNWVRQLQTALPAWAGVGNLVVDGHYGPATSQAVRTVQRRNGLHPDGVAGSITTSFMRKHGSKISNPPKNRP